MAKDFDPFERLEGDSEEPELRALLASLQGEESVDLPLAPAPGLQSTDQEEGLISEINAFLSEQTDQVSAPSSEPQKTEHLEIAVPEVADGQGVEAVVKSYPKRRH